MKAVRIHGRGGPEQLVYEDAPKPTPQQSEALVRVLASGVTPTELSWPSAYTKRDKTNRLRAAGADRAGRRPASRVLVCRSPGAGTKGTPRDRISGLTPGAVARVGHIAS
jgi:hypothetical protein